MSSTVRPLPAGAANVALRMRWVDGSPRSTVHARVMSSPPARQKCVTKCCEHPERTGVMTVIDKAASCRTVDWEELAPTTGTPGPELAPPALALAEPADVVDLDPAAWTHAAVPRSR